MLLGKTTSQCAEWPHFVAAGRGVAFFPFAIRVCSGSPRMPRCRLAYESPFFPPGFVTGPPDHQLSTSLLSAQPRSSALISVRAASRCSAYPPVGVHRLCALRKAARGTKHFLNSQTNEARRMNEWSSGSSEKLWRQKTIATTAPAWLSYLSSVSAERNAASKGLSPSLSLSQPEVHLSWKRCSSSATSLSPSLPLPLWRRGSRSAATGGRSYRGSSSSTDRRTEM